MKKTWDPAWKEVVVYLAGPLSEKIDNRNDCQRNTVKLRKLLSLLKNQKKDDYFGHRLALQCLPEISAENRPLFEDQIDAITQDVLDFWQCEESNWTPAVPHLTRTLSTIDAANGKVRGKPLMDWLEVTLRRKDTQLWWTAIEMVGHIRQIAATAELLQALLSPGWGAKDRFPKVFGENTELAVAGGAIGTLAATAPPEIQQQVLQAFLPLLRNEKQFVVWGARSRFHRL